MQKSLFLNCVLIVGLLFPITMNHHSISAAALSWESYPQPSERIAIIKDLAIAPGSPLFILTGDVNDTLWSTNDQGSNWTKLYNSSQLSAGRLQKIYISSNFNQNHTLYALGMQGGSSIICKSVDGGGSFQVMSCQDPATGSGFTIDSWCLAQDDSILAAAYDGNNSWLYFLPSGAGNFDEKVLIGSQVINNLVLSPNYAADKTLAAGGIGGGVYFSQDSRPFQNMPADLLTSPLRGSVSIAFDINYTSNKIIYACGDQPGNGIFRLAVGSSLNWEIVSASLPNGAVCSSLVSLPGGVLYCLDMQPVEIATHKGGLARLLNPSSGNSAACDLISSGINARGQLLNLWKGSDSLWSFDSTSVQLMRLRLDANENIILNAPPNQASGLDPTNVVLSWLPVPGVVLYEWQVNTQPDFTSVPSAYKGQTGLVSLKLPGLVSGVTYYWRVGTVDQTGNSWSAIRSFSTQGAVKVILFNPPNLVSGLDPSNITLSWKAVSGVSRYDWQIDSDPDFTSNLTAYKGQTKATNVKLPVLETDTLYYWKVRASNPSDAPWSETRSFSTVNSLQLKGPQLLSPVSEDRVSIQPVLKWAAIPGALNYEICIAADDTFKGIIVDKSGASACSSTVWLCDRQLEYKTAYYWKVRAINTSSTSDWSAVSLFITEELPVIPTSIPVIITPQASFYPQTTIIVTSVAAAPTITVVIPLPTTEPPSLSSKMFVPLVICVGVLTLAVIILVVKVVRKA
jgi:hypothetical protein